MTEKGFKGGIENSAILAARRKNQQNIPRKGREE
jgi:hypothetical protein